MTSVEVVELESAYVLHRRPYSDTSALVELLTGEDGRVGLVAKGVRRGHARQAALLQPFQPLRVSWRSRGDLGTLTGVEAASSPMALSGRRMVAGFYANELLLRLLVRHQAQTVTFSSYAILLAELAGSGPIGPSLRVFERDLLMDLGYGLILTQDSEGAPVASQQWYRYDPQRGPLPVGDAFDGHCLQGASLLALARGEPRLTDDDALKRLTRAVLGPHLGEAPIKSRELYARYRDAGQADNDEAGNE